MEFFTREWAVLHSITAIELTVSIGLVLVILIIAFFYRKSFIIAASITGVMLLFFFVRSLWIDNQVSKKIDRLNLFLEEKYPNEEWEIGRYIGR